MAGDYFTLHRQLIRSDKWLAEPFTRGQAWVDLLGLANYRAGFVRIRGIKIPLDRGQLAASSVWLSTRWKWSRAKVVRFLSELETEQQIEQQKNNVTSIVTITNYIAYQGDVTANVTANVTAERQQNDSRPTHKKKNKESKEQSITIKAFGEFWKSCPRKIGRAKAEIAYQKSVAAVCEASGRSPEESIAFLLDRVTAFAGSPCGRAGKYCPHPATWLNQGRFDDDPAAWQDNDKGGTNGRSNSANHDPGRPIGKM